MLPLPLTGGGDTETKQQKNNNRHGVFSPFFSPPNLANTVAEVGKKWLSGPSGR